VHLADAPRDAAHVRFQACTGRGLGEVGMSAIDPKQTTEGTYAELQCVVSLVGSAATRGAAAPTLRSLETGIECCLRDL